MICWALLLSAQTLAAAIMAKPPLIWYSTAMKDVGWLLPLSAWTSCAVAIVLLVDWQFVQTRIQRSGTDSATD